MTTKQSVFTPHSILPFLPDGVTVIDTLVRDNGVPVLHLSSQTFLAYNTALSCWTRVAEPWWTHGSDVADHRRSGIQARGPVSELESKVVTTPGEGVTVEPGNQWWGAAMTLGHLETRIHAAQVLESGAEWKHSVLQYAKCLADEGFHAKAEELAEELCGPVYWYVLFLVINAPWKRLHARPIGNLARSRTGHQMSSVMKNGRSSRMFSPYLVCCVFEMTGNFGD